MSLNLRTPPINLHPQNLRNRPVHLIQNIITKPQQRPVYQPFVIDGTELIDQKIGILVQSAMCGDTQTKRLSIVNQVGAEGNDEGGRMVGVQKRLVL